ncbi:MAG TPA: hypothetical protein VEF91_01440 [Verrucomicrobiae bacterium]|nr:hypothetical protein [Verrucomicrobiae bacterium]
MRDSNDKVVWGQVEKIGKGTRASYDPDKKTVTFCFTRNLQTSSEQLRKQRETLRNEINELGFTSRVKYNGEVVVDNVKDEDLVLVRANHKLIIHLNKKQSAEKQSGNSEKPA